MSVKKTIIGITGNIATGKSVVRHMLTNAGALSIDADVIAHRLYYKDGPAYEEVLETFGQPILSKDGQISRQKLGQIVFSDTEKLRYLEAILHPLVIEAIQERIDRAQTPIIAVEAIKLLEAGVDQICDQVWVSHATTETQLARLMQIRNLTEQEASLRLALQTSQIEKRNVADVVINTEGSFFNTWQQVIKALNDTIKTRADQSSMILNSVNHLVIEPAGQLPGQQLTDYWIEETGRDLDKLYEVLGLKLFTIILQNQQIKAMAIWQDWNFTATLGQIITAREIQSFSNEILAAFERHSQNQQCEICLIPQDVTLNYDINPTAAGFGFKPIEEFIFPPWRVAAQGIIQGKSGNVWVKFLNQPVDHRAKTEEN